jgi:PadR family transcriptional regulator PadR
MRPLYWGRMRFRGGRGLRHATAESGATRIERFVEPCILLLLAEQNRHGYNLRDELIQREWIDEVDFGHLYRTLRRMEEAGLVSSEWAEEGPGPLKRVYHITLVGRRLLNDWVESLRQTRLLLDKFLRAYDRSRPQ